jgi:glycosyltransferase involved in cell wall biosynthesis
VSILSSPVASAAAQYGDISVERLGSMSIFRSRVLPAKRRVLYLNSYGMATVWPIIESGVYPAQHLWGCIELVRMGYEVAMPDEVRQAGRGFNYRRQDRKHAWFAKRWLGKDGVLYSGHTILFWTPLLAQLGLLRCPIVTMLYARGENLRFAGGYRGVLALTPAAAAKAKSIAPRAEVSHIGWGVDFSLSPILEYSPKWFLACGKTRRDFETVRAAADVTGLPVRLINKTLPTMPAWPQNVQLFTGEGKEHWQTVPLRELVHEHYGHCSAALIILEEDREERCAAGFTQLLEAMALGRPVIVTRTGALAGEVDVEGEGCGIFVPANDASALANAMRRITADPERAKAMGLAGRRLCEERYNMTRYGAKLHELFQKLR